MLLLQVDKHLFFGETMFFRLNVFYRFEHAPKEYAVKRSNLGYKGFIFLTILFIRRGRNESFEKDFVVSSSPDSVF